jgi:hypothetical protein
VCGVAGSGFIVIEESDELGDASSVGVVLCGYVGESLYASWVVFCSENQSTFPDKTSRTEAYLHDKLSSYDMPPSFLSSTQCVQKSVQFPQLSA